MTILTHPLHSVKKDDVVVVKLWETYLLYHPANLYRMLTGLSIDNGPSADEKIAGRVIFRFHREDWEREIEPLLQEHRIPVVVTSIARSGRRSPVRTRVPGFVE